MMSRDLRGQYGDQKLKGVYLIWARKADVFDWFKEYQN